MSSQMPSQSSGDGGWHLRLYVAGQTVKTIAAVDNIRTLCDQFLGENYQLEIIDLLEEPELAEQDKILAVPMLVRKAPTPVRKIIGDLSNVDLVSAALDFQRIFPQV
jgi:circadian clock protein KaiB